MTFKDQIKNLIGDYIVALPADDSLTQWLRDGVVDVINRIKDLNPNELSKFINTTSDDSDDGIVYTGKILSVVREHDSSSILRECTAIPSEIRYDASDVDSLMYRSKINPGYYILDKKIHSIPKSAGSNNALRVSQVHYDETIAHGSDDMAHFPREYIRLVPLYASCRGLESQLANIKSEPNNLTKFTSLPDDIVLSEVSETLPSYISPTSLNLPADLAYANIDFSTLPTYPAYISPNLTIDTFPTISYTASTELTAPIMSKLESWLSSNTHIEDGLLPTEPAYTAPALSLESVPIITALNITELPPTITNLSDNSATFTEVAPSYMSPTLTYTVFPTDIEWSMPALPMPPILDMSPVTQALQEIAMPADAVLPDVAFEEPPALEWTFPPEPLPPSLDFSGITQTIDQIALPADVVLPTMISIPDPPTVTYNFPAQPLMKNIDWGDLEHWITEEEDAEMAAARINAAQVQASTYRDQVQGYSAEIDAQLTKNRGLIDNWASEQNSRVQVFSSSMQALSAKYRDESAGKQSIVNAQVATLNAQISKIVQTNQAEVSNFQAVNQSFQAKVTATVTKNQALLSSWGNEMATRLQKYTAVVSAQVQLNQGNVDKKTNEYTQKLQIRQAQLAEVNTVVQAETTAYQAQIGAYQAQINATLQKNSTKVDAWTKENTLYFNKFQNEGTDQLNRFNADNTSYQAKLQVALQNAQLSSNDDAQKIQKYQSEVQTYQAVVNKQAQEWQANTQETLSKWNSTRETQLQKYQSDIQSSMNSYERDSTVYSAKMSIVLKNAELHSKRESDQINLDSMEVQKFQALIQDNTSKINNETAQNSAKISEWSAEHGIRLQEYQARVQSESTKVQNEAGEYKDTLAKLLQTYQAETGSDVAILQSNVQKEISRFTNDLQEKTQSFTAEMQKFQSDVTNTKQANDSKIAKHQTEVSRYEIQSTEYLQEYALKMQVNQSDYQQMAGRLVQLKQEYNGAFNLIAAPEKKKQQQQQQQR